MSERKQRNRAPITERERQRRIQKKKAIRRKKRILIAKRLIAVSILVIVVVFALNKLTSINNDSNKKATPVSVSVMKNASGNERDENGRVISDVNEALGIDIYSPKNLEGEELYNTLSMLASKSEKYASIYNNINLYPEKLLNAVCNNAEMADFVLNYSGISINTSNNFSNSKNNNLRNTNAVLTKEEKNAEFPLFLQWDERWGYEEYGDTFVGVSGCAPTCVSMVVFALTGDENDTPDVVARYAKENDYYLRGTGTKWTFLTEGVKNFGIRGKEIALNKKQIISELKKGHPIICSMKSGIFTAQGHFIVLVGINGDKIIVNDPNSIAKSQCLWDYEVLEAEIKNLWSYSAK